MDNQQHGSLWLSVGSFFGSVISFMYAHATMQNVAWLIGCVAGLVSIYAGILTIREKRYHFKKLKRESDNQKNTK